MNYIELKCTITPPDEDLTSILVARLSYLGYESFIDTESGFNAYIPEGEFEETFHEKLMIPSSEKNRIKFEHKLIEQRNWNAEWEANFKPVVIDDVCMVRTTFHEKDEAIKYDIIIEPQMSFGTAHHETTEMMIRMLLKEDIRGKTVLDMGCGTGILSILAVKLGAGNVLAVDIDEWAYNNTLSNVIRNNTQGINVKLGDAAVIMEMKFDLILANINRNILLNDLEQYYGSLNEDGSIVLSGFYQKDMFHIEKEAYRLGFVYDLKLEKNDWVTVKFRLINAN